MVHVLIQLQVQQFDHFWQEFQTRGFVLRQAQGALGSQVFRHATEPEQVIILFQWDSQAHADAFLKHFARNERVHTDERRGWPTAVYLTKVGELEA